MEHAGAISDLLLEGSFRRKETTENLFFLINEWKHVSFKHRVCELFIVNSFDIFTWS